MRGNVNQATQRPFFTQNLCARLRTEKYIGSGQSHGGRLNFFSDKWGLRARHSQNKRSPGLVRPFLAALHINTRARCIRQCEIIDQIPVPVVERVEGHMMKRFVRLYNEVACLELRADWV